MAYHLRVHECKCLQIPVDLVLSVQLMYRPGTSTPGDQLDWILLDFMNRPSGETDFINEASEIRRGPN